MTFCEAELTLFAKKKNTFRRIVFWGLAPRPPGSASPRFGAEVTGKERRSSLAWMVSDEIVLWKQTWFRTLLLAIMGYNSIYKFNYELDIAPYAYCLPEPLFLVLFLKRTIYPSVVLTKNLKGRKGRYLYLGGEI
jgi:hypothetical protein